MDPCWEAIYLNAMGETASEVFNFRQLYEKMLKVKKLPTSEIMEILQVTDDECKTKIEATTINSKNKQKVNKRKLSEIGTLLHLRGLFKSLAGNFISDPDEDSDTKPNINANIGEFSKLPGYDNFAGVFKNTYSYVPDKYSIEQNVIKKARQDIIPGENLLFVFNIFAPICSNDNDDELQKPLICTHQVVMLGENTLDMLCDKIVCFSASQEMPYDISDHDKHPPLPKISEKFPSRMIYIGKTFYIDDSDESKIDYSININEFLVKHGLKQLETRSMYKTKCMDLEARLCYPYVFQHIGSCEHIITISDVRLVCDEDCLQSSLYPFYSYVNFSTRLYDCMCTTCNSYQAKFIVTHCARFLQPFNILCWNCYHEYCYIDGKKDGSFIAHRFTPIFCVPKPISDNNQRNVKCDD